MEEAQRQEFYDYAVYVGFIVPSVWNWDEHKLTKKIKQYMKKGYRLSKQGHKFEVINIFNNIKINKNIENNVLEIYHILMNEQLDLHNSKEMNKTNQRGKEQ